MLNSSNVAACSVVFRATLLPALEVIEQKLITKQSREKHRLQRSMEYH